MRTSLGLVDFLRLVSEFGNKEELEKYSALALAREDRLYDKKIYMVENSYSFEHPTIDLNEALEMMFGTMSEITEETVAWDPNKVAYQSSLSQGPVGQFSSEFSDMDPRTEPNIAFNYTEINETDRDQNVTDIKNTSMSDRITKRHFSSVQSKQHRRPMKSMSFDASLPSSPYHYITSENQALQQEMLHAQDENIKPPFQVLNEHETVSDTDTQATKVKGQKSVQSAIHTLEESSKLIGPGSQRSMSRRLSAPPSLLIDTLNRRKLSALSILERANISTEGLHVTSDIESGMNEARLEWLRENVRKKAERRVSQDEEV